MAGERGLPLAPVMTVVEPEDRADIERIGAGLFRSIHREAVSAVARELRDRRVSTVLLAASRCRGPELASARRLVSEFPLVPTKAVLTSRGNVSPADILALGNCGVRQLVDVRAGRGWDLLRAEFDREAQVGNARLGLDALVPQDQVAADGFVNFLEVIFDGASGPRTMKAVAHSLGLRPSTLMSRFLRAGLPTPKRYLALAGLVRAARLLENPGFSIADAAMHLNHSSAQSFGRHIRLYTGMTAGDFRHRHTAASMLDRFREELITPYRAHLERRDLLRLPVRRGRWAPPPN